MDPDTFAFYLKQPPDRYAPRGREIPPYEQVLADLQARHGERAGELALAYLALELRNYLLDTRVPPLAEDTWRLDPDSSPLFPRVLDAQGEEIITVRSRRPPDEVTAIARLIAAAPILLRACQAALAEHEQPGAHTWAPDQVARCDVCDGLRSAITLATTGREDRPEYYDDTAAAADARLRAAAPALLAACRAALARLSDPYLGEDEGQRQQAEIALLTAAIRQATGEEVNNA